MIYMKNMEEEMYIVTMSLISIIRKIVHYLHTMVGGVWCRERQTAIVCVIKNSNKDIQIMSLAISIGELLQ